MSDVGETPTRDEVVTAGGDDAGKNGNPLVKWW